MMNPAAPEITAKGSAPRTPGHLRWPSRQPRGKYRCQAEGLIRCS